MKSNTSGLVLPKKSARIAWGPPDRPEKGCKNYRVAMSSQLFHDLPKALYPSTNRFLNPPVFQVHYGYAFKWEWLCDYARKHDLLDLYCDSDDPEDISFDGTIDNVYEYIVKEAQISSFALEYCCIRTLPGLSEHFSLMVICSNYKRGGDFRKPKIEDVKKLQRFLGFSKPPGWFVDHEEWGWKCRDLRTFTV